MAKEKSTPAPFPTKADIIRFVEENPGLVGKNEIARAFHVRGDNRALLKDLLRDMAQEGLLERGHRRSLKPTAALPNVTVVEITGQDVDGELLAKPVKWTDKNSDPPRILVAPGKHATGNLGAGDRVLARLERLHDGYQATILKKLEATRDRMLGVYRRKDARVVPTDKRERSELIVEQEDSGGAQDGELVLVEIRGSKANRLGLKVPQDLSICGFDDMPAAKLVWPQLTTVRQPIAEMSAAAVELLVKKQTGDVGLLLDFELVERGSTGPVPTKA